jgi:hypothetical protein
MDSALLMLAMAADVVTQEASNQDTGAADTSASQQTARKQHKRPLQQVGVAVHTN